MLTSEILYSPVSAELCTKLTTSPGLTLFCVSMLLPPPGDAVLVTKKFGPRISDVMFTGPPGSGITKLPLASAKKKLPLTFSRAFGSPMRAWGTHTEAAAPVAAMPLTLPVMSAFTIRSS